MKGAFRHVQAMVTAGLLRYEGEMLPTESGAVVVHRTKWRRVVEATPPLNRKQRRAQRAQERRLTRPAQSVAE